MHKFILCLLSDFNKNLVVMWLSLWYNPGIVITKERHGLEMTKELFVRDAAHVTKINEIACCESYDIWLHIGSVMLDAKSLLSLHMAAGERALVVVEDYIDEKRFDRLVRRMAAA